jgi:hypothetical protein
MNVGWWMCASLIREELSLKLGWFCTKSCAPWNIPAEEVPGAADMAIAEEDMSL